MTTIMTQIETLIQSISPAEKAQVLHWVARDLGGSTPGITNSEGVAGGAACIVRTRIPVWLLEQARRVGTTEADILKAYPVLTAEDITNGRAYARGHREEIDAQIRENEDWLN